jgi:hypothetical protein
MSFCGADWRTLQVLAMLNTIFVSIAISHGTGRHTYYLTDEQRVTACRCILPFLRLYYHDTCFGKVPVALFLLRLIGGGGIERWFYAGIVSLLVVNITCTAFLYAQCTPVRALWEVGILHKCWDPLIRQRYSFFQGCKYKISGYPRLSPTSFSFFYTLGSCARAISCENDMESQNEYLNQTRTALILRVRCFVSSRSLLLGPQLRLIFSTAQW